MGKLKKTALVAGITVLLMSAAAGTAYALLNARTVTVANQLFFLIITSYELYKFYNL